MRRCRRRRLLLKRTPIHLNTVCAVQFTYSLIELRAHMVLLYARPTHADPTDGVLRAA